MDIKRRCSICRKKAVKTAGLKALCGRDECFDALVKGAIKKAPEVIRKANYKKKKEFYSKKLTYQHDLTQPVFNRMRVAQERLWFKSRCLEPYCISCRKTKMDFCCGHYTSRGSNRTLAYDVKNTYLQCNKYCNKSLSANKSGTRTSVGYDVGLAMRFGESEASEIIAYCKATEVKIWDCDELIAMRARFSAEHRRLIKLING